MLSFELEDDNEVLLVHADEEGLDLLVATLERLRASTPSGHFDHTHLFHPEWGGHDLSADSKGGHPVKNVKIYCWKGGLPT